MRIAYLCYWDARRPGGVTEKIASQVSTWRSEGHDATVFVLTPAAADGTSHAFGDRVFPFRSAVERVVQTHRLYAEVVAAGPELAYLRYDLFAPPPARLMRRVPTVVEVNSDARAELAARGRGPSLYGAAQDALVLGRAAGAVCVTHELADELRRRVRRVEPRVIANGISLDDVPVVEPAADGGPVRLVYLGDDVYWQGVDKVFDLAEAVPEWHFDLVGVDPSRSTANVTCYGFLPAERYETLLAAADAAIGTLALHRKRMDEACALKVRRYLAHGLPVVLGHADTDFVGADPWFLLRLPNEEANIRDGVDRVRAFVDSVRGRRVAREECAVLDVRVKEAERLAYFAEIVGSS